MQTTQPDYTTMKAQLEEKVATLRREREAAMREVESLSLKVAIKDLERQARSLEGELDALKGRRSLLEQKLAAFDAPPVQTAQPQQKPPVRPIGQ